MPEKKNLDFSFCLLSASNSSISLIHGVVHLKYIVDRRFIFGEEMQNTEKIVVGRPVPSRPFTSYKSFSEPLAGAIHSPAQNSVTKAPAVIKPKTFRLKNYGKISIPDSIPSQPNLSERAPPPTQQTNFESPSLHKPLAKVAPKSATSPRENMGHHDSHQKTLGDEQSTYQDIGQVKHLVQTSPSLTSAKEIYDHSDLVPPNMEQDAKAQRPTNNGDRPSYDGYNWRKYGQKEVKGSEYPRSYYKCTHPSCPMKKQIEKSFDGQIAEIVYRGQHNHPKPQPPTCLGSGSEEKISDPLIAGSAQSGTAENYSEVGILGTSPDPSVENDVGNRTSSIYNDRHKSKGRKIKDQVSREGTTSQCVGDTEPLMQTCTESHVTGDGFRWRKYGQKIVKGNSYPRSYYKCTHLKCNARKHIERASDDPRSFITTYEGKHNHEMQDKRMN